MSFHWARESTAAEVTPEAMLSTVYDELATALYELDRNGLSEYFSPSRKQERFRQSLSAVYAGLNALHEMVREMGELAFTTPGMVRARSAEAQVLRQFTQTAFPTYGPRTKSHPPRSAELRHRDQGQPGPDSGGDPRMGGGQPAVGAGGA